VTIDMGGTSTDVSTIIDGRESFTTAFEIAWGVPSQIPQIDIRTIGAGGGSLAWIDKGGILRVGPHSAGASPGPSFYGNGGTLPTVTDANLVLGRINPDNFLGGSMALDVAAAERALAGVGRALRQTIDATAMAIVRIANNNMIGALSSVLIERGLDPRDFALLAFGGAGPLHAGELIAEMGIPRAIVPNHPGQFSAYGFTLADARVDRQRTTQLTSTRFDTAVANQVLGDLVRECLADLEQQGYRDQLQVSRSLEMRYLGQNYELELPVTFEAFDEATTTRLWQAFHEAHEARFGFAIPGEIIEIVNYLATAVSITPKPEVRQIAEATGAARAVARREVGFVDGRHDAPVFRRQDLLAGHRIEGPAVVEEAASVTVLGPGQRLTVDAYGHLLIQ
jgi:N-methylhydantoinase A